MKKDNFEYKEFLRESWKVQPYTQNLKVFRFGDRTGLEGNLSNVVKMVIFGGKFWGFRMTKRISGLISFGFIFFYIVLFFVAEMYAPSDRTSQR